ncbi:fibronectin type III domain-containing protein [Lacinutrix sp. C3R15]|uniref:fibronectin type III domain-containing protein n=1 Tax=Flavobacteriaceae TaxID=49546 RepID=UPI001C088417|nr:MULTISPECIES: fibronectin type III domain-containing protein [Flavobacteriaceae]MBU2939708.1 fibronectin type III domain-containing protein [Lacinutrix sp. C3R15]MDO6623023.1 fibronectin type III domain-containing protein [Oceanihabitans sp. 1_MG-2023]
MKNLLFTLLFACTLTSCFNDPDDEFIEQCLTPINIQLSNTTQESTTITWEDSNTFTTYTIEYGVSGFTLGFGETLTTTDTNITLVGLEANTSYDFYIQSICSDNVSMLTNVFSFTTTAPIVVSQFVNNLSDMHIYSGNLEDLNPSPYAFEYDLISPLFTDYAYKQRIIALPSGEAMQYVDNGLPIFPDNTVIAKTFYYFNDERDITLGKKIMETRILIKQNGSWVTGNYKWNEAQTEATLDPNGSVVAYNYVNNAGEPKSVNYEIPSNTDCFTCHSNNSILTPIGPKLRSMHFNNQLQSFVDQNLLSNITDVSNITMLPDWKNDRDYSLMQRARAYFDVNCAHCHSPGGTCDTTSILDFSFERPFDETNIYLQRFTIQARTQNYTNDYSMPLIGTTMIHAEGYALIEAFVDSL